MTHHRQYDDTMDGWADRPITATAELAIFLGGGPGSFTGEVLKLITKAQATPANMARLTLAFPREVQAWRTWMAMSPAPTYSQLAAELAAQPAIPTEKAPSAEDSLGGLDALRATWRLAAGLLANQGQPGDEQMAGVLLGCSRQLGAEVDEIRDWR